MPLPFDLHAQAASLPRRSARLTPGPNRDPRTAPFVLALLAAAPFSPEAIAHLAFARRLWARQLAI